MPLINYIDYQGNQYEADVEVGQTVMQGAKANGIDGIVAECGGNLTCATCHVYVDKVWQGKVGQADVFEKAMLDAVMEPQDNSRMSCQIMVTDELDGLIVRMPQYQF